MDPSNPKDGQIQLPDAVYKALARVLYPKILEFYENHQPDDVDDDQHRDSTQDHTHT